MEKIQEKLKLLPDNPGVYIMLDKQNSVIYVGKAKNLKNRVRQYFHASPKPEKVRQMVEHIEDFYYIITNSEIDALSLENNLIKKYKPKYNILLKDDKRYPYIKLDLKTPFPTIGITRKISKSAKYYGPFMGGVNVRDVLEILQTAFSIRSCTTSITQKPKKPCLNYHIKRCLAPCAHCCTEAEYAELVKKAMEFLEGDFTEVEKLLNEKMNFYASNEDFELALDCREKLRSLEKISLKRITNLTKCLDADIVAFVSNGIYSAINILIVRKGNMQGAKNFAIEDAVLDCDEAVTSFVSQYYQANEIPQEIILQENSQHSLIKEYFKNTAGKLVEVSCPKQGIKAQLLQMAISNANEYLDKSIDRIKHKEDMTKNACLRLQQLLSLKRYPKRMECYDISNISGVDKVGSMVVMFDGEADRNSYRRFRIKTVEGANDFESLKEVLTRRLSKLGTDEEEKFPKPDLIIIDGGKGQLSSVKQVFDDMKIEGIELISLAKREEEVFTCLSNEPIIIPKQDYSLRMLQRIRDESHRFAITYFRSIHSKSSLSSVLEEVEGIGKVKRLALIERFKDIDGILNANEVDIASTQGIGESLAKKIITYLQQNL